MLTRMMLVVLLLAPSCKKTNKPDSTTIGEDAAVGATREAGPESSGPASATRIERPFLWKIDKESGPTYLFGTIHIGVDPEKELPPSVWKAFEQSTTFAMEADVSKVNFADAMRHARLPPGEKLSSGLTTEQWTLLVKLSGMPEAQLEPLQPWLASFMMLQRALAAVPPGKMDVQLQKKATGKTVEYFETANAQLEMLRQAIDMKALGRALDDMQKEGLTEPDAMVKLLHELIAAYRKGDSDFDFTNLAGPGDEAVLEALLYRRNREWIPLIEKLITRGHSFIAVGAAHLLGPKSVIELLREKGYEVERVR